jgi:hypothetical protein
MLLRRHGISPNAQRTLTNFRSPVMAGLEPASYNSKYLVFFWMAASKGGHDDKIGGNVRVIKFRDDGTASE